MGEEPRRIGNGKPPKETKETPGQEVARLRGEIESTRSRLGTSVNELDRRRHELLDWRLQLKRHAGLVAAVAGGLVLAIGGAVALGARRERRRNAPVEKARRVKDALSRLIAEPELVSRKAPESTMNKVLGAAGATAASFVAKRLIQQFVPGAAPRPRRA